MRNVLFLVTGMTPQIITETVWALACDPNNDKPWVPDEIHVLSTEDGLNQIRSRLFSEKEGYKFAKFKQDFPQLAKVAFDNSAQYLHNIYDAQGVNLKDLKTPSDNELAADLICQKIREFTECDDVSLHVSIAGGRKTMGFYAGYALSLYGRAGDSMSHVLVDERYESARDFFYPTPDDSVFVTNRDGIELKAKDAQIWLARIPFVRMRGAIPERHQLKSDDSFSQVVEKINQSFHGVTLLLDVPTGRVVVNDKFEFELPAREFALLHWFADLRQSGADGVIAPKGKIKKDSISEAQTKHIAHLSVEYGKYYKLHKIKDVFDDDDFENLDVDKQFFENVKSRLKEALELNLGLELAAKLELKQEKRGMPFYLNVNPAAITIVQS